MPFYDAPAPMVRTRVAKRPEYALQQPRLIRLRAELELKRIDRHGVTSGKIALAVDKASCSDARTVDRPLVTPCRDEVCLAGQSNIDKALRRHCRGPPAAFGHGRARGALTGQALPRRSTGPPGTPWDAAGRAPKAAPGRGQHSSS